MTRSVNSVGLRVSEILVVHIGFRNVKRMCGVLSLLYKVHAVAGSRVEREKERGEREGEESWKQGEKKERENSTLQSQCCGVSTSHISLSYSHDNMI